MRRVLLLTALALVACKNDKSPAQRAATAGSGSALPAAAPGVSISVDGTEVAHVDIATLSRWPRLDTLVPVPARRLGTWQSIELVSAGRPPVVLQQPSASYPALVPVVFPGDEGAPAFGMFDPVEHATRGKPEVRENAISAIRVTLATGTGRGENEHGEGGGVDPATLELTIHTKAGDKVIKGSELLALPREAPPGAADGGGGGGKGWKLSAILATAGITTYQRLLLADAKGTNLTLEKQDVDPATAVPFIKLNRQGLLRFRVYRKQGDSWQPGSDLRGLARVEVLK